MDGINCGEANSTQDLRRAFGSTGLKEHKGLWIVKTSVESFPEDVLGDFVFAEIHLNFNSNLTSFSIDSLNKSRPFLRNINLYGNALLTFEFHRINQFPKLTVLNLGKNRLDAIPNWAFSNPQLKTLILAGNPIRSLGLRAFAALPTLEMLNLEGTRITNLGDFALTLYSSYPKLTRLLKAYSKPTSSGQRLYHRPFEVSLAPEGLLRMEPSATFFRVSTLRKRVTICSGPSPPCRSLPKTTLNTSVTSTGRVCVRVGSCAPEGERGRA
ncbi:hypothetical protein HPB47_004364 [Ixodes persulcatus]|uniref:Uncharacterized protein n=1 Tax=Ixodes persulcatus TaxID=34615 RepID=A0AC60PFY3_IXOPE|nr:hypothetical protein HPB47_004364 [Ixodes persulcatus]